MKLTLTCAMSACMLLLSAGSTYSQVTNGFFNDGLNNWDQSGLVRIEDGAAMLYPEIVPDLAPQDWTPAVLSSTLGQNFVIDAGTDTLTFSFLALIEDTEAEPETDWFSFRLNGDLFYQWSSSGDENIGSGVTVMPPPGEEEGGWTTVNLSIDSGLWGGAASIAFKLDHEYDLLWDDYDLLLVDIDPATTISIDNVQLTGTPIVVPAPAALGLALVGFSGVSFFRKRITG